jgi:tetratricopeptide (TPR) repeat protein
MSTLKLTSRLVAVACVAVVAIYAISYGIAARSGEAVPVAPAATSSAVLEPDVDTQIAFWSKRVADRNDAYLELTLLGEAFARKARESGDVGHYTRAQIALERALRVNPDHAPAVAALSGVLLSLHEFERALAVARPVADRPNGAQALATVGDAQLALGRYGEARAAYARLGRRSPSPASWSRLAALAELRGQVERALDYVARASALARESGDVGESLAFYSLQAGEISFRAGRLETAEGHYRVALGTFAGYVPALAGLAKVRAAQRDYPAASALYERATASAPQPELLAALGDVYAAAGADRAARRQFATVEVVARLGKANRQVFDRQLALFYADRRIRLTDARRLALGELRVRKDVYGFDAAAWVLARSGRCAEALPLARSALRLGTKDPLLFFHRGYVEGCAGDPGARRAWYARALAVNPEFSVRWARVARAVVERSA